MKLQWEAYLFEGPRPADAQEIERLEQRWGVPLPEDYKQTVLLHQGMTPEPCAFHVGRVRDVFNTLLTVSTLPGKEAYSVDRVHSILKPLVPSGIFPFADTPGGEYLCFDYRALPEEPEVILITVEGGIHRVARNFTEFMDGLEPG